MEFIEAIRFPLHDDENIERMLIHLKDYGYAVIGSVANSSEIEQQKNLFWEYLEGLETIHDNYARISRSDPNTWQDYNWVGNKSTGIIRSPNFCHSDFMWNSRTLPKVKKAFSEIWKTNELIVSYDAGNAFRPWKYNLSWLTDGNWWHVDQNCRKGPHREGRVCVQGLVTYYDVTEETGGLCVIPGSHLFHEEICKRSPSGKLMQDYVYISENDPILSLNPPVLIGAKAGDLILWDSRLVHCSCPSPKAPSNEQLKKATSLTLTLPKADGSNLKLNNPKIVFAEDDKETSTSPVSDHEWINIVEGNHQNPDIYDFEMVERVDVVSPRNIIKDSNLTSNIVMTEGKPFAESPLIEERPKQAVELIRLVSYVCMLPRSFATSSVIRSKKRGYLYRVPTSHWPTELIQLHMIDEHDYYGTNWRDVSVEKMKLIGFSNWEIQLHKFRISDVCRDVYNLLT